MSRGWPAVVLAASLAASGCAYEAAPPPPPAGPPAPSAEIGKVSSPASAAVAAPAPRQTRLVRALEMVRNLGDEDLVAVLRDEKEIEFPREEEDRDAFMDPDAPSGRSLAILEAVRRGGKGREKFFESLIRPHGPLLVAAEKDDYVDLELLTALRRLQGRPDPLEVAAVPGGRLEVPWPEIPVLEVVLRNREKEGPGFVIGPENNYRGGFLRAFRFDVARADGTRIPGRSRWGDFGGVITAEHLRPGESWRKDLDMRDYVAALDAGTYTVRAQYGDDGMFSNAKDLRGRVFWQSAPFTLVVGKRRLAPTRAEDDAVRAAFRSLPDAGPVRFVVGTSVKEHTDYIPADSPEGVILGIGWNAVPALLAALDAADLTPRRRAWALALLFGITGAIDPRPGLTGFEEDTTEGADEESAEILEGGLGGAGGRTTTLGESRFSDASWECLVGGPHSTLGGQGGSFVMSQAGGGGEPSRVAQDWLARRWKKARANFDIVLR